MPDDQRSANRDGTENSGGSSVDREWISVCPIDEISDDMGYRHELADGSAIAAFQVDGEFFAINDLCTHGNASLADGFIHGFEIECPFHGGRFDIRSGDATGAPCSKPVAAYPTKVEDGQLFVQIPATSNVFTSGDS